MSNELADAVFEAIGAVTEPLHARIKALELTIAELKAAPLVGPPGPPGASGERGADGAAGPKGESLTVGMLVQEIEKNEYGLRGHVQQMVEDVSTEYLKLNPPARGVDGAPGEIGQIGPPGPHGAPGTDGAAGPTGERGEKGLAGDVGLMGAEGIPGRDGLPGVSGPAGLQGKDGVNGLHGKDGTDGLGFDDLRVDYDGERTFSLVFERGEQVKTFPFTVPFVLDRGVFAQGKTYQPGDGVTWGGSFYVAQQATAAKPGESSADSRAWRLTVKRGGDGKTGVPGPVGPSGPRGESGPQGKAGY